MADSKTKTAHEPGTVKVIENKEEFDTLLKDKQKVIVDFTATWCGPCKMIAPVFAELATKNPEIVFCKVDVDELEDVAAECGISAMPTFQSFKEGKKVKDMTGANKEKLEELVLALK